MCGAMRVCRCSELPPGNECNSCYAHRSAEYKRVNPCACGCGQLAIKQFVNGHNVRVLGSAEQSRRGRKNDGSKQRDKGSADWYRKVGGRHEHRIVAEKILGRQLTFQDVVHHKNGDKKDNRPENLEVMTRAEHIAEHRADMIEALRRKRAAAN